MPGAMTLGTNSEGEDLGGGRHRLTQHLRPVAYDAGGMRRIANRVAPSGDPLLPMGTDELLQFRCRHRLGADAPAYHIGHGGSGVFVSLLGCNPVEPVVSGQSAYYAGAYPGADLRLTVAGHRVAKEILLREGHPRSFSFRLRATRDFDPDALTCGRLRLLSPYLARDGVAPVPLSWRVADDRRGWLLSCDLPAGDWAGWTLDPTVTLQPGPGDGKDASLRSDDPAGNWSVDPYFYCMASPLIRGIVQFDLSGVPDGATIGSATISLYQHNGSAEASIPLDIYPLRVPWTEAQCTWNSRQTGTPWTSPGAFDPADCQQVSIGSVVMTYPGWRSGALSAATKADLGGYGWLLVLRSETGWRTARTSDYPAASDRPQLVIEYTEPRAAGVPISLFCRPALGGI